MKKIYLRENSISSVLNKRLLPKFIFDSVKAHETSLGDNTMFPNGGDYPFDYTLLKLRFSDVCDAIEELNLPSLDEDTLVSELSECVKLCRDMERPIRDSLEKICENAVNRLFAIPEDIINLNLKIVDKITFKNLLRLKPESMEDINYTFSDVSDIELYNKAVEKRRFIDSLIQGASYTYSSILGLYVEDIDKINKHLIPLYDKIRVINDYLLFTKKEEMSDKNPMQGSYVEVKLGIGNDGKSSVNAQGIIFPLLFQETIKGMFELFSSHGLPKDMEKAIFVIKKADFLLAEPWDMRFGVGLWNMIFGNIEDTNMVPYVFKNLVELPCEEFASSVKEILSSTSKGKEIMDSLAEKAEYDSGYQEFTNRINARNVDKSLIQDSYFSAADANGYEIDSHPSEEDVIEEDGDTNDYFSLIANASVDNIDFIEGDETPYGEEVFLTIDGIEIPSEIVRLSFRPVFKTFPSGRVQLLNIDIMLDKQARGHGLGTKIYAKAVYEFGAICSRFSTRHNDDGIRGIFSKLNSYDGIYTFEDVYENLEGKTINDYYAMLKSQIPNFLGESVERGKELITENWSKDKKRIVRRTIDILRDNLPWMSELELSNCERKIVDTYFHGRKASNPKFRPYEQLIAKILSSELGYPNNPMTKKQIGELKQIFGYVYLEVMNGIEPDIYYKFNEGTNRIEGDNFKSIHSKYYDKVKEYRAKSAKEYRENGTQANYKIIEVPNFDEARKYADYSYSNLKLCFTTHDNMWDTFTDNGNNTAYVCLKDGWKDIEEKEGKNTPYDDYGLSMIWVFVDESGEMTNCCIRWNHHNEGNMKLFSYGGFDADNALSVDAIENIVGVSFDDVFVNESVKEFNSSVSEVLKRLESGESFIDVFSDENIKKVSKYLWLVSIDDMYNFIDERNPNEFVYPNFWFDGFKSLSRKYNVLGMIFSRVGGKGEKYTLIDNDGENVLPNNMWVDRVRAIFDSYLSLIVNDKANLLDYRSRLLFPRWASVITQANPNMYFALLDDGRLYGFNEQGNIYDMENVIYEYLENGNSELGAMFNIEITDDNIVEVGSYTSGKFYNIIDENGKLASKAFFKSIARINDIDGFKYKCSFIDSYNLLKDDGTFLVNAPINSWPFAISNEGNYFICQMEDSNGGFKANIVDKSGQYLLKGEVGEWPNYIRICYDEDELFVIRYYNEDGEKFNLYDAKKDKFIWDKPRSEWFDKIYETSPIPNHYQVVINGKTNFINYSNGELLIKNEPNNWYDTIRFVEYRSDPSIKYLRAFLDGKENIIFDNGTNPLFPIDDLCEDIKALENKQMLMYKDGGKCNIFDLETRKFATDEWFDSCSLRSGQNGIERVFFFKGNLEYVYDVMEKTLENVSDYRNNWPNNTSVSDIDGHEPFDDPNKKYRLSTFIPNKMYRITFSNGNTPVSNVLVKRGDRYEYLFDRFYDRILSPMGNAMCLVKGVRREDCDIYDINANKMAFTDIPYICEVDREDEFIIVGSQENTYNIITKDCEMLFDEWYRGAEPLNERYILVNFGNDIGKNIYDVSTRTFVSKQNYASITLAKGMDSVFIVGKDVSPIKFNVLNANGEPMLNTWYQGMYAINSKYLIVYDTINGEVFLNYVDAKTGEYISDKKLDFSHGEVSRIEKNGKVNFISGKNNDIEIKPLLDEWADSASEIDGRGYVEVTYGNNTFLYKAEDGKLLDEFNEGERGIPDDFTEYQGNSINLIGHTLYYKNLGNGMHKVVVADSNGNSKQETYQDTQGTSSFYTMYGVYDRLCRELGIEPASVKHYENSPY